MTKPPKKPAPATGPAIREVTLSPAQATHYAKLESDATTASQEAERVAQIAAQPLLATAESLLLGGGVTAPLSTIRVLGIGGTPEKPTLRYIERAQ